MSKLSIHELMMCGIFVALIVIGTFIRIPIGASVYTLQFLFTLLAGLILGARLGAVAVGAYMLLGLIGVPVFASGGGLGYLLQPTFGYLPGFILQAYFCGYYARKLKQVTFRNLLTVNLGGMAIVYLIGIGWFYLVSNYVIDAPIGFAIVLFYCGVLQIVPDFILCLAAAKVGLNFYHRGLWEDFVKVKDD